MQEKPRYRKIQYGAWLNDEYGRLVENLYREQAAIQIQRMVRVLRSKKGKTVSIITPVHLLSNNSARLAAIQEPTDDTYLQHVEKIQQGKYCELDYKDPEFIRNIYKALRLNTINQNQLLMAYHIHQAMEWLHDYESATPQLNQHRFNDPYSPYYPEEISYATPAEIDAFYHALKREDAEYVTINFPKNLEHAFFLQLFDAPIILQNESQAAPIIFKGLSCYAKQLNLTTEEKERFQEFIDEVNNLEPLNNLSPTIKADLINAQTRLGIQLKKLTKKDEDTLSFLLIILSLNEQLPGIVISKHYQHTESNSPVLSFVVMTPVAQKELQLAVHNAETTLAVETLGTITTRMIRAMDERPQHMMPKTESRGTRKLSETEITKIKNASASEKLQALYGSQYKSLTKQGRPVAVVHPDATHLLNPHGYYCYDFLLSWHDYLHCWRNGANFKNFIRHERNLFTHRGVCQAQDFVMSKSIWWLTDLDLSAGGLLRSRKAASFAESEIHELIGYTLTAIFEFIGIPKKIDSDIFLLHLIDIKRNPTIWNSFVADITPENPISFEEVIHLCASKIYYEISIKKIIPNENSLDCILNEALLDAKLIEIIEKNRDKTNESLILRLRLRDYLESCAAVLIDTIDALGIEKFFYWGLNSGLLIQSSYQADIEKYLGVKKLALDELTPENIIITLIIFLKKALKPESVKVLLGKINKNAFKFLVNYLITHHCYSLLADLSKSIPLADNIMAIVTKRAMHEAFLRDILNRFDKKQIIPDELIDQLLDFPETEINTISNYLQRRDDQEKIEKNSFLAELFFYNREEKCWTASEMIALTELLNKNERDRFLSYLHEESIYLFQKDDINFLQIILKLPLLSDVMLRSIETQIQNITLDEETRKTLFSQVRTHVNYIAMPIEDTWSGKQWLDIPASDRAIATPEMIANYCVKLIVSDEDQFYLSEFDIAESFEKLDNFLLSFTKNDYDPQKFKTVLIAFIENITNNSAFFIPLKKEIFGHILAKLDAIPVIQSYSRDSGLFSAANCKKIQEDIHATVMRALQLIEKKNTDSPGNPL